MDKGQDCADKEGLLTANWLYWWLGIPATLTFRESSKLRTCGMREGIAAGVAIFLFAGVKVLIALTLHTPPAQRATRPDPVSNSPVD